MNTIEFKIQYKSIQEFNSTELPNFTILLGTNGAGKTHMLKALFNGNVVLNNISKEQINYFNLQTFLIKNQRQYSQRNIDDEKLKAWNHLTNNNKNWFISTDEQLIKLMGEQKNPYRVNENKIDKKQKTQYEIFITNINNYISQRENNPRIKKLLKSGIFESGKYASKLSQTEFFKHANYEPDAYELLDSLSEVFLDYQKKLIVAGLRKKDGGQSKTKSEIDGLVQNSPWIFLNRMFEEFGLKHTITCPTSTATDLISSQAIPFQVKLKLEDSEIDFEDLSSGEKILCALAVTVYQDHKSEFPKLMLLDEVDASLHPSMIQHLLNVIQGTFIENNCKVILATHSPTTVALSPKNTLFEMKKGNQKSKIVKVSRSTAIEILSEGYMTLEGGLKLFDSIFKKELTLISEGKNYEHIKKALTVLDKDTLKKTDLYKHNSGSGDADLFGLFEFIKRTNVDKQVLFIWDCDSIKGVNKKKESKQVFKFIFDMNTSNSIAKKGIENLYPESLFTDDLIKKVTIEENGTKIYKSEFSENNKNLFIQKVKRLRKSEYFKNYQPLLKKIKELLKDS